MTDSEVRLEQDRAALTAAQTDPRLVLDGEHPRLIDEYQLAGGIWNAVRGRIDAMRDGELLVAGRLQHVCVETATWGKTPIPDWVRDGLRRFAAPDAESAAAAP
jgi:hypothetical protein